MHTTAVILAGGSGVRMGGNKPFHVHDGVPLVERVMARLTPQSDDLRINAGQKDHPLAAQIEGLGLPVLYDSETWAGLGPLSGVLTGLEALDEQTCLITAPCDMPNLPVDMVAQLQAAYAAGDADIVYFSGARDYPLCALWSPTVREPLKAALAAAKPKGGLSVFAFLATQRVKTLKVTDESAFLNINAP